MSDSFSTLWAVHGIFQARILEWVVIPSPGDLPDPGIKPMAPTVCLVLQEGSLLLSHWGSPTQIYTVEYYLAISRKKSCHLQPHE